MYLLRRLRGMIGTAVTWGLAWSIGSVPVLLLLLHDMPLWPRFWAITFLALLWGAAGAATGGTFALLVTAFERQRTVRDFRTLRAALWGGVAGGSFALATVTRVLAHNGASDSALSASVLIGALLGAASGACTLALAHRASEQLQPENAARVARQAAFPPQ